MRYAFNVIALVDRQNDVYQPMKIQKFNWPTVVLNVIAALARTVKLSLIGVCTVCPDLSVQKLRIITVLNCRYF